MKNTYTNIAVIGLGYVGLPLALAFNKKYNVVGFDIDSKRTRELSDFHHDRTGEVTDEKLKESDMPFTSDLDDIKGCNVYVITVPTPVNKANQPDMTMLINASMMVGKLLDKENLVIYESTVYPGATEEVCVPVLEAASGLRYNEGFYVGYSPERINPGDAERGVEDIVKVTSGSTPAIAPLVDMLYNTVIDAGTHMASSIKVAEAAKVIENTQRDVNIALINELAMIFERIGIDTQEVLEAAGSKWNFLPFRPGLVGGHCIGVDPYYLTYKAQELGYHPEVILSGRRVNDGMGTYVASEIVKTLATEGKAITGSRVLVLGYTFKENCPDTRNTKVINVIRELGEYGIDCDVHDPVMDQDERLPTDINRIDGMINLAYNSYDAILIAVAHDVYKTLGIDEIKRYGVVNAPVFDLKSMFNKGDTTWRL